MKEGRFGPYVTDGETNASLRRGDDPESITIERGAELLADRRSRGPAPKKKRPRAPLCGLTPQRERKLSVPTASEAVRAHAWRASLVRENRSAPSHGIPRKTCTFELVTPASGRFPWQKQD